MHDPKGGDQSAYQPPAGTTSYGSPPVDQPPPYQKPPTDPPPYGKPPTDPPPYGDPPKTPPGDQPPTGNTCEPPTGDCRCKEWPVDNCPSDAEPCRRLLEKLESILETFAKDPTDATKKFADDLKDADKEYQSVNGAVKKYKEFYDKLDCKLAEAANWKKDLEDWVAGKISDAEKAAIENSRKANYDDKEQQICCDWLQCRDYYNSMLDCLEQSKKNEDEAKDNYEGIKALEKTLTDRFADLKSLYDKAKGFRDEERYRAVYAVTLEYNDVYDHLSELRDWDYARTECSINSGGDSSDTSPAEPLTGDLKKDWTPEKFKTELLRRLRLLVLAKYQRFRWQQDFLSRSAENQKKKDACEKFRKERRDKFIQEADDIAPADGGGGYGEKPPTGDYPDEQPPDTPPPSPPPYQGGQNPGYPPGQTPPTQPPTQQYQTGDQPKYPEPPPPPDKYRGRPKS